MADNELSMEARVLLAFALSALVLILFAPRTSRNAPQKPAPGKPAQAAPATATTAATPPAPSARKAVSRTAPPEKVVPKQDTKESETTVENDLYSVRFSNRGGVVKSWILKQFRDRGGNPLDLVNAAATGEFGAPFSVWTDDQAAREQLNSALFVARLSSPRAPATLTFEFSDGTVEASKEFRFEHGSYVVGLVSEVKRAGAPMAHDLVWRGGFGDHTAPLGHLTNQIVLSRGEKHEHLPITDIKGETRPGGPFSYVGIEDMFFTAVFMPGAGADTAKAALDVAGARIFKNDFKPAPDLDAIPLLGVGASGAGVNNFRLFVGPKALEILKTVYPDPQGAERAKRGEPAATLGEMIDFGWFGVVAVPLFVALKWIYNHIVPNYGWAIVLLTTAINFALFPLKLTGMKSAMKMQKLAPQIKAIQDRYKKYKLNDPKRQAQNEEVMALYKKHGVNPLGGCLPMLLQIPFLYGFYKVLSVSIEMRQAPWILWMRDLSTPEPHWFKVLPILMIVTMVVLQKMTPQTSADPVQQKMFMMMPLMFGVMFYNVSSGLVLYWLVGNIVQIGQQWYINKIDLRAAPE